MAERFRISAHGRLQDWIADEHGYFAAEGLDYEITVRTLENVQQDVAAADRFDVRVGAYELYRAKAGGKQDMSCACHWAVNQAASDAAGRMWGRAYSILPSAIFVAAGSPIETPEQLAGVPVTVGYHSGSHFSTIQALEAFVEPAEIRLAFGGMPYDRVDALLEGEAQATAAWGAATYILDQLGARRITDTTFMAGFMFNAETDAGDVERYFAGLRRAQAELDFAPERHKHHYLREMPERYRDRVDVRRFGTGERIVFEPYTREMYEHAQQWMRERGLFEELGAAPDYEAVVQA
jgi:NitT/TauT family transport system substrate-binding protein